MDHYCLYNVGDQQCGRSTAGVWEVNMFGCVKSICYLSDYIFRSKISLPRLPATSQLFTVYKNCTWSNTDGRSKQQVNQPWAQHYDDRSSSIWRYTQWRYTQWRYTPRLHHSVSCILWLPLGWLYIQINRTEFVNVATPWTKVETWKKKLMKATEGQCLAN